MNPLRADRRCYVIAEAGVNHDGDPAVALELVHAAREAGADAVKFQLFDAGELASPAAPKAAYQQRTTDPGESQLQMLKQLQLPEEAFVAIAAEAKRTGIDFLCTAYSERAVDVVDGLGVRAHKIASAQVVEPALIAHAASKGKPLLISTGMATMEEIGAALAAAATGNVVLLQCTTDYPSAPEDANLRAIPALANRFGVPVGYSDHTTGTAAALAAIAFGAGVLEKHLTTSRARSGPDHAASLEPDELAEYVRMVREAESALGDGSKEPRGAELANRTAMRRSAVAATDIPAGTVVAREHLALRRPGDGISPAESELLIGRRALSDVAAGTQLRRDQFE